MKTSTLDAIQSYREQVATIAARPIPGPEGEVLTKEEADRRLLATNRICDAIEELAGSHESDDLQMSEVVYGAIVASQLLGFALATHHSTLCMTCVDREVANIRTCIVSGFGVALGNKGPHGHA